MATKLGSRESAAAVLATVTAEMAKPRVVESAKRAWSKKEDAAREPSAKRKTVLRGRRKAPFQLLTNPT
jgi:hypothetical protein